ncbi:hypothetical protein N5853_05135 [Bartonella sp. HY329]|uniref:hypothetical protein n=1 Tax=unclassified Bartonella TaxID=2645622 RepID=UPI0021C86AA9|nr:MULTISPECIES: hypothetical protein [unclassified Bartonella]UXM96008.1 hypothetical protein N5853_05135 [Bartonella sp. HY329]UXN10333.1 hypothetical protein N5852_05145 [Bartonella sp. HY328]
MIELEIEAGEHSICAGINLFTGYSKLQTFTATDDQVLKYEIYRPLLGNIIVFPLAFFILAIFRTFNHGTNLGLTAGLLISIIICIFLTRKYSFDMKRIQ